MESDLVARGVRFFGAHAVPDRARQERQRALQRALLGIAVGLTWSIQYAAGMPSSASPWFMALIGLAMPAASLLYRRFLERLPSGAVTAQYLFLLLDPVAVVGVLLQDPETFAFLNPLMLVVIVRNGIQFGIRTMYLAWGASLIVSLLLFSSSFWRSDLELTFAYFLMLAFVPVFFDGLIRQIHATRASEEERARSMAMQEQIAARSGFLSKVGHELRSPLQGILSALDVIEMRHSKAFGEDQELIGRMRRASMLINTQLRDLLTLAKGEAGRLELNPEPLEACALVEAMADSARDAALAKGLRLVLDLPDGPVFVRADGARIDQVLTNLVVNSIRHTDSGEIRVRLRADDGPPAALRFVVTDTGVGIPEALLPTLFAPETAMNSPARRGEGSGIGLAIVRLLVDRMGGTLGVESRAGEGAAFSIRIPVEPVDAQAPGR